LRQALLDASIEYHINWENARMRRCLAPNPAFLPDSRKRFDENKKQPDVWVNAAAGI